MAIKRAAKQIKYGIIRQNTSAAVTAFATGASANSWTNPGLAATQYRTVLYNKGVVVPDPAVTVTDYGTSAQLGLNYETTNFYVDATSGLSKMNFSGVADKNTLAPHLIGALQAVTEDTTPYEKDITSGFVAGTIDFKAGAGYLHSLAIYNGSSDDDGIILENAVIDNLSLTFDFIQKGVARLVNMSGTWVGNEMNFDQTFTTPGNWASTTLTPFMNTDLYSFLTFTVDGVDWSGQCVRRMVLNINNNVTSNCATAGGKPNQYDFNPEYTWTVILDHNLTTEKVMGDFKAGGVVDINFGNALYVAASDTDGQFGIDAPNCRITGNPYSYNGDFLGYAIPIRAYQGTTVSPISINLIDGLDWGY